MYINEPLLTHIVENETEITTFNGITLEKKHLEPLHLPTGKIVANDPFVFFDTDEFTVTVAPGRYPVFISIAHLGTDRRVALAAIQFSQSKPVRWEMALIAEQDTNELIDDEFFGYGVDAGTGGFVDKQTADKISELSINLYDKYEDDFDKTYVDTYSYLSASITDDGQNEFAAFSSGYGDGCYPSYFGFDEDGKPCVLITDFLVIDSEEETAPKEPDA